MGHTLLSLFLQVAKRFIIVVKPCGQLERLTMVPVVIIFGKGVTVRIVSKSFQKGWCKVLRSISFN